METALLTAFIIAINTSVRGKFAVVLNPISDEKKDLTVGFCTIV